ncbi:unnamed protein product [Cuscuta epithymum]|uniref:UBC core domain-containing protein n=1 Tax=Cuscuta epithymum TaxID=186058 RepID=A0AAV0E5K9_9ASTE|nr:unnamed protein product [Cuscuta epithymum]
MGNSKASNSDHSCHGGGFLPLGIDIANNLLPESSTGSSSSISQNSSGNGKEENGGGGDIIRKHQSFRHFDTVDNFLDHHYIDMDFQGQQLPKAWSKNVQHEWKVLDSHLPGEIYVRVCETRMDLLRAIIVGPQGTPYHDGIFVFDAIFPPTYPDTPPMVHFQTAGLSMNPNLYACGKVCLSLLNTWTGDSSENWQPNKSTMLQVLVSIQGLVLNANPFFNAVAEPDI